MTPHSSVEDLHLHISALQDDYTQITSFYSCSYISDNKPSISSMIISSQRILPPTASVDQRPFGQFQSSSQAPACFLHHISPTNQPFVVNIPKIPEISSLSPHKMGFIHGKPWGLPHKPTILGWFLAPRNDQKW